MPTSKISTTTSPQTSSTTSTTTTRKLLTPKKPGVPRDIVLNFEKTKDQLEGGFAFFPTSDIDRGVIDFDTAVITTNPDDAIIEDYAMEIG